MFTSTTKKHTARAACVLALAAATPAVASASAEAAQPIPGQYIVTLAEGHDPQGLVNALGANARHVYRSALNGFAAKLSDRQLAALRRNPNVVRIEQDELVSADDTQTMDSSGEPWGLDRIDQTSAALSGTYSFTKTGAGVRAYVLDSGVQTDHPEFEGRAAHAYDATGSFAQDCNSHGTHVAGTIGSKTFGVAKKALIRSVKVIGGDCGKSGPVSDIIDGVDWVRQHHVKPAVANLSLGGSTSGSLDDAVENLVVAGVFVSVAAGNETTDACDTSPARAPLAYTVAATDKNDYIAPFTNWGECVDVFAPGVSVKSTVLFGKSGWKSGTSMASPHVAGTAALLCSISAAQCQPWSVTAWLHNNSLKGAVKGLSWANTPNRLLFKSSL